MPDDIEEFLRRAAQRRQAKAGKPAQRPVDPARPAQQAQRPAQQRPAQQRPLTQEPTRESQTSPQRISQPSLTKTSSRPEYSSRREERPSAIPTAELVVEVAELVEPPKALVDHVNKTFGHKVGTLEHQEINAVKEAAPLEGLMKVLSTPDGIRTAVLLREVLDRPQHRW